MCVRCEIRNSRSNLFLDPLMSLLAGEFGVKDVTELLEANDLLV